MVGAGATTVVGAKCSTAEECKAILKAGECRSSRAQNSGLKWRSGPQ